MFYLLTRTVSETGLWDGSQAHSHGFLLTPEVYHLSAANRQTLDQFAPALRETLSGVARIAAVTQSPQLGRGPAWNRVRRLLLVGVPKIYRGLAAHRPATGPAICKVDFMERPDGSLCIAEIDGHNKHGMGYSVLGSLLRRAASPDGRAYPGVAAAVATEVRALNTSRLVLLAADQERFYLPDFKILRQALAREGVELVIVEETNQASVEEHILGPSERDRVLLVDLPFMYRNPILNQMLPKAYLDGKLDFLFPPKPFLGSKTLLGLIRNEEDDPGLEAILRSHIHPTSLKCVRALIPPTYLISKATKTHQWRDLARTPGWVIKDAMSSGMKGTSFADERAFQAFLARAGASYDRAVLQEQISTRAHRLRFFTSDGVPRVDTWYLRITAHITRRAIADLCITARRDRAVHGAKDALMFGAVFG